MMSISIRQRVTIAAAVAACAFALPAVASASTATGCPASSPCEFVAGTGHDASTNTGGSTQFQINPRGATYICSDSRAHVVIDGSAVVSTALAFNDCSAAGFNYNMTCTSSDLTIDSVLSRGNAAGLLLLDQGNCTVELGPGFCTIETSATAGGQDMALSVAGAAAGSSSASLTLGVQGNTDAVTFTSSGPLCGLLGIPASGDMTFSNSPNSGDIVYDEVGSRLDVS